MKRVGFKPPKLGPHTLRHTFRLRYILNGGDVSSLSGILGHADAATTMLYVDMSTNHISKQHQKYSPFARLLHENEDIREHHLAVSCASISAPASVPQDAANLPRCPICLFRPKYRVLGDWNRRRLDAQEQGIEFNEPPPFFPNGRDDYVDGSNR